MATLQSLNDLATAVKSAAEAYNTAVAAATAEAITVDTRINYVSMPGMPGAATTPAGITATVSLPLPLPVPVAQPA